MRKGAAHGFRNLSVIKVTPGFERAMTQMKTKCDNFTWFTAEQIRENAALPTAFRQFWEEIENV